MSFSTIAIRTVGIGATALSLHEMNVKSKEHATYKTRDDVADGLTDLILKHNVNTNGSEFTESLKEHYLERRLNDNYVPTAHYIKNRVVGFIHGLTENIVPLTLGLGAMLCASDSKSKLRLYKGWMPKWASATCAATLGALALISIKRDVM